EVAVSRSGRAPVPVRPAEPLAGTPDRGPFPLADSVAGGVAAAQQAADAARTAAGGVAGRFLLRVQDALPARSPRDRRVTPMTARREMQQRAALAILSFVIVIGALGAGVYFLGGHQFPGPAIASFEAGQQALSDAQADLGRVLGPGVDLVANDPRRAAPLLTDAMSKLSQASSAGIPAATIKPLRDQAVALIDRLYHMQDVGDTTLFTFPTGQAIDLRALVRGPDGASYVLDAGTKTIYRIDLAARKATSVFRAGTKVGTLTEGEPRLMTVGGRDLVILDSKSIVWRWTPANATGRGTTHRLVVAGASEWGNDILAIGTFVRNADTGLYNLYIVDPSAREVVAYLPALDGGSFPTSANRLTTPRDVSGITALFIDGDIWAADTGRILRIVNGRDDGWKPADPGDAILRPVTRFTQVTSGTDKNVGNVYGFDAANQRVLSFQKADGTFLGQYRLGNGSSAWSDLRSWFVQPGVGDQPDTLFWISGSAIHSSILESLTTAPGASPGSSAAPSSSAGAGGASRPPASTAP
ncbi:MAG TPA: hypothetical protein VGJ17_08795, partial [Candidatus Limnocylindrales bacterium]